MFGTNKIMKPEIHPGEFLDVQEIFPTLQGEGPYTGHPSVFIRLGGCNLACKFCDTEFDSYKKISLKKILSEVKKFSQKRKIKLIVITGGEPLRQPIERLCAELVKLKFLVQIETNGTIFRKLPPEIKIICSPKPKTLFEKEGGIARSAMTGDLNPPTEQSSVTSFCKGGYHPIRPDLLPHISAFKFIISKSQKNYSQVAEIGQKKFNIPVYVQPMDEYDETKNRANREHCLKLCQQHGYFLSLQIHKILGIK